VQLTETKGKKRQPVCLSGTTDLEEVGGLQTHMFCLDYDVPTCFGWIRLCWQYWLYSKNNIPTRWPDSTKRPSRR
jgi:hypothetical protein